jgi:hypothetical protein
MRRAFIAIACVLVALLAATAAGAKIRITRIDYNPPGADTGSNKSLNAERVRIKNTGTTTRKLRGWRIRDRQGHVYIFGLIALGPGRAVILHTGRGDTNYVSEPQHTYWQLDNYVWNNGGDRATLRNRQGTVVDRCSYSGGAASVHC